MSTDVIAHQRKVSFFLQIDTAAAEMLQYISCSMQKTDDEIKSEGKGFERSQLDWIPVKKEQR